MCYNQDWIQSCLISASPPISNSHSQSLVQDGTSLIPVLIRPWGSETFPPKNPYEMMNQIGAFLCDNNVPSPGVVTHSSSADAHTNGSGGGGSNGVVLGVHALNGRASASSNNNGVGNGAAANGAHNLNLALPGGGVNLSASEDHQGIGCSSKVLHLAAKY